LIDYSFIFPWFLIDDKASSDRRIAKAVLFALEEKEKQGECFFSSKNIITL
jgi:hypothetical protein